MIVFCPSCGSRISVEPTSPGGDVECPRCHSTFATAGLKSADGVPPPKRFRPKKTSGSKIGVLLIALAILLVLGGGAAAILYFTGVVGNRPGQTHGSPNHPVWQEYTSDEGRFSVLFPSTVVTREEVVRSRSGKSPAVRYSATVAGATYVVAFHDLPGTQTPQQMIEQSRAELSGGRDGKLLSEKDVTAGTTTGKEFVVETPGQSTVHMRFFAAGKRLYKLSVAGTSSKPPDAKDVAKFFDSFRIAG